MKKRSFLAALLLAVGAAPAVAQEAHDFRPFEVTAGDVTVKGRHVGEGPTVTLIPSLGRSGSDFDEVALKIAATGYQILLPEPRWIGGSDGPREGVSQHDLARDVALALCVVECGPTVIVGHAFGNRVARTFAADHPELTRAVILIAAGGLVPPPDWVGEPFMRIFEAPDRPVAERVADIAATFFAPANDAHVWAGGWYVDAAFAQIEAAKATKLEDWWYVDRVPLLIIQGKDDVIAPPANGHQLKEEIGARATVVDLADAGHALLPEQPGKIAAAIVDFLKSL